MRKVILILFALLIANSGLKAQNYFLQELQNDKTNDIKSTYKYRIENYLDSLDKMNSEVVVFNSDSAKRDYYKQIISDLNQEIKYNPKNPDNYILKAIYKTVLYEYDSAEIMLNKVIELYPEYEKAYLERGVLYLERFEVKKAISDFKTALKINPEYTDAIYNLGYTYLQQAKYSQAEKYFEQVVSISPYHYQTYIQLGYLNLITEDIEQSINYYNKAIEINPFEPAGYNLRGQAFLYSNKIEKAKKDFEKSLSIDPSNYSIIFLLGYIELESGDLVEGFEIIAQGTKILNNFTFADRINDYGEAELNDIIINYHKYIEECPESVKDDINESIKYILENKNLYRAHYLLKKIMDNDSTLILPHRLYVNNLFKTGRILANIETIDDLLKKDNTLSYVYLLKGNVLTYMEKYMEAIKYYDKVIKLNPEYSIAYAKRAWCKYRQGKIESAFQDVELSMKDVNPYLAAVNVKAALLDALNKHQESLELYNLAIDYFPDQPFLYNNRALTYLELHEKEKAIEECNKAIELSPEYSVPYSTRGSIYLKDGNYSKAIKDFDKALELDPGDKYVILKKANAYIDMGDEDKAIELYEEMMDQDANVEDLYLGLSSIYIQMENYEKAIEFSTKAIDADKTNFDAYVQRARAKSELKKVDEAIQDLDQVLEIDSTNIQAIFEKARIYSDHDQVQESITEYKRIIEIDSTSNVSYGNIGWNYYLLGEYEECIKWSEKAIEIDDEALYAMYNIALSYLCMGDYKKSEDLYKKYHQLNLDIDEPVSDGAIKDLQDLIEKGVQVEKAKEILRSIFKIDEF